MHTIKDMAFATTLKLGSLRLPVGGPDATLGETTANGTTAVVVSTTAIKDTSKVFLANLDGGGTPGILYVSAQTNNVSFSIKSTNAADTATVAWLIITPIDA